MPIYILPQASGGTTVSVANGFFVRSASNTNIEVVTPLGTASNGIYVSNPVMLLPANSLNFWTDSNEVTFDNVSATITADVKIQYLVRINFKMTTASDTNYTNKRELRIYPAALNGNIYDAFINSNLQPGTGEHAEALIMGVFTHTAGDVVTLRFETAQTDTAASTSTKITIFRIDWLMTSLS